MNRPGILVMGVALLLFACTASAQVNPPTGGGQTQDLAAPDSILKDSVSGTVNEPLIHFKKGNFFRGSRFSLDGKNYDPVFEGQALENALTPLPSAVRQYRSAHSTHNGAYMLAMVGGVLIGVAVGWGILGNHEWTTTSTSMLAGGLGITTGAMILDASAERRVQRAVEDFNFRSAPRISLHLGAPGSAPVAAVQLQF